MLCPRHLRLNHVKVEMKVRLEHHLAALAVWVLVWLFAARDGNPSVALVFSILRKPHFPVHHIQNNDAARPVY